MILHSNTKLIIAKCYKRIWMLRNLKKFGASEINLVEVYYQQVRSITEMACPVWNAGITQQEVRELERIQKVALAVIRGDKHTTYKEALEHFKLGTIESRREKLCLDFALKALKNPKFCSWFKPNHGTKTRSGQCMKALKEVITRKSRYRKSPIPYLTIILNTYLSKQNSMKEAEWSRILNMIDTHNH